MTDSIRHSPPEFTSDASMARYVLCGPGFLDNAEVNRRRMIQTYSLPMAARKPVKRAVDILGAFVGIVLFGPLMLIIAALVKREGGDAIFAHERLGRNGQPFLCLKFRTMVPDAKERLAALLARDPSARAEWERDHKLANDPRITALGAFLRKTSLDELPQFFNVLRGEMSLVGPRPITAAEREKYGDDFELYAQCRPGITGIWQVSGRNNISYPARVALDAQYALNQSIMLDAAILFRTFGVMASGSGSGAR